MSRGTMYPASQSRPRKPLQSRALARSGELGTASIARVGKFHRMNATPQILRCQGCHEYKPVADFATIAPPLCRRCLLIQREVITAYYARHGVRTTSIMEIACPECGGTGDNGLCRECGGTGLLQEDS